MFASCALRTNEMTGPSLRSDHSVRGILGRTPGKSSGARFCPATPLQGQLHPCASDWIETPGGSLHSAKLCYLQSSTDLLVDGEANME
jgi:hypothetical protein